MANGIADTNIKILFLRRMPTIKSSNPISNTKIMVIKDIGFTSFPQDYS